MRTPLQEAITLYRTSTFPQDVSAALISYARAVDWNAAYALAHADDEPERAAACLVMALEQLAVLCGGAPGTTI